MNILLLSCNTGEGHNSASKALKKLFEENGDTCFMADALAFRSKTVSKLVAGGHVFIYTKTPKFFDVFYNSVEKFAKTDSSQRDTLLFKLLAKGAVKLYEYIVEHKIDRIVCFHPLASQMLTKARRDHSDLREIPTYLVATDYVASPGVGESNVDVFVTPHADVEHEFVRRGVAKSKIVPIGIPINPAFARLPDKSEARKSLELPETGKVMLLMCGSMGCGPIEKLARRLSAEISQDTTLVIICGNNKKLYRKLSTLSGKYNNVRVLGFTDKMALYMRSADLYLTKPGGLSSTEAACVGLPMVLIDAVAGCETYNLNFFTTRGCAVTAHNVDGLVQAALSLLYDEVRLAEMSKRLSDNFDPNQTVRIYEYIRDGKKNN